MIRSLSQHSKVSVSASAATLEKYFAGSLPLSDASNLFSKTLLSKSFHPDKTANLFSLDPFAMEIATKFFHMSSLTGVSLGGLGGISFAGKMGWTLFRRQAILQSRLDNLLVYGCSASINSDGEIESSNSAIGEAFAQVEIAGGISGLNDAVFRDRHDIQHSFLLLEIARLFEESIAAHPNPIAKLAYANFGMVQDSLRKSIDWSDFREGRLASLGGITIHVDVDTSNPSIHFLPLSFELFDPVNGQLEDLLEDLSVFGQEYGGRKGRRASKKKMSKPPRLYHDFLFPMDVIDKDESEGDSDRSQNHVPPPPPSSS